MFLNGEEFNKMCREKNIILAKTFYDTLVHNDYLFTPGLNTDKYDLKIPPAKGHGFYFCKYVDMIRWLDYGDKQRDIYSIIEIPNKKETKVYIDDEKYLLKCSEIIIRKFKHIHYAKIWEHKLYLDEVIHINPFIIKYLDAKKESYTKMCVRAINANPFVLEHIQQKTLEICYIALKRNMLVYVPKIMFYKCLWLMLAYEDSCSDFTLENYILSKNNIDKFYGD